MTKDQKPQAPAPIQELVKSLIRSKKDLTFYPETNPMVHSSLRETVSLLQGAKDGQEVTFKVNRNSLLYDQYPMGEGDEIVEKFAEQLYLHQIRSLCLQPDLSLEELKEFLRIINTRPEEMSEKGSIEALVAEKAINHIKLQTIDKITLIEASQRIEGEGMDAEEDISDMEAFDKFLLKAAQGSHPHQERLWRLLKEPKTLASLLENISVRSVINMAFYEPSRLVAWLMKTIKYIGDSIEACPDLEEKTQFYEDLSQTIHSLPSNTQNFLLQKGLLPNLKSKTVASEILSRYPARELSRLLTARFALHGASAQALKAYMQSLALSSSERSTLIGALREDLEGIQLLNEQLQEALKEAESAPEPSVHPEAQGLSPEEKKATLEELSALKPSEWAISSTEKEAFKLRLLKDLSPSSALRMDVGNLLNLLWAETAPEHYENILNEIEKKTPLVIQQEDFPLISTIIDALKEGLSQKEHILSGAHKKRIGEFLDSLQTRVVIEKMIDQVVKAQGDLAKQDQVMTYLSKWGAPAVKALLNRLEKEESRSTRSTIILFLAKLCSNRLDLLVPYLKNDKWYVVRNIVLIMGKIGHEECLGYLKETLEHRELRVRREAIQALANMKSPQALKAIVSCLNRPDLETRKAASRWLAIKASLDILPDLLNFLNSRDLIKEDLDITKDLVNALGVIESEEATALLTKLSRQRAFWQRKRASDIRDAAQKALQKIPFEGKAPEEARTAEPAQEE